MKKLINNIMGSWITSGIGVIVGLPEIWMGLSPLFDEDPATGADWKLVITGIAIFIGFLVARDGNKSSEDVKIKESPTLHG